MDLLDKHYAILSSSLRQSLVKSLILLRNRGHLKSAEVLPLFFRLFRCQDKSLRDLLFKHIVAGMLASVPNDSITATQVRASTNKTVACSTTLSAMFLMLVLCATYCQPYMLSKAASKL